MLELNEAKRLRSPAFACAGVVLAIGLAACGASDSKSGAGSASSTGAVATATVATNAGADTTATAAAASNVQRKLDMDDDYDANRPPDDQKDNGDVTRFGHAATGSERRAIASVANRYYAAITASDGAGACALLAALLERTLPEFAGKAPGRSYVHGTTCPVVASLVFQHSHAEYATARKVIAVRVDGDYAYAIMRSHGQPPSYIGMVREKGAWKAGELLGSWMP